MNYKQIAVLIPYYDDYGQNSTCILFQDGSRDYRSYSVKHFIYCMFYQLHLDPNAVRFWTSQILGTKLNTPLIVDESLIFIPVKFRKSIGKQDGCFAYINSQSISSCGDYKILLTSGETIDILSPKSYVLKKQNDARLLSYAYMDYKKQYEFMWKN